MNKFDGLDIVLAPSNENTSKQLVNTAVKKSFFGFFSCLALCGVVALLAAFNLLTPVKVFLQTEYDYSNKTIINLPFIAASAKPTNLTIKMPFASAVSEVAGELILTPYDVCVVKAGISGIVSEVVAEQNNKSISIVLENGCLVKYSGLNFVGVKNNFAVAATSPIGLAENSVKISAYYGEIRLPLTVNENGEIIWQN